MFFCHVCIRGLRNEKISPPIWILYSCITIATKLVILEAVLSWWPIFRGSAHRLNSTSTVPIRPVFGLHPQHILLQVWELFFHSHSRNENKNKIRLRNAPQRSVTGLKNHLRKNQCRFYMGFIEMIKNECNAPTFFFNFS